MAEIAGKLVGSHMIHINSKKILLLLLTNILLMGCSARVADLSFISTKNIELSEAINLNVSGAKRYSGEDCSFFLMDNYPFLNKIPNLEAAVEDALNRGGGNIMVDEVTEESDVWVIIGNIKCIYAEGTVLNVPVKSYPY